jgi:hypothetical protein
MQSLQLIVALALVINTTGGSLLHIQNNQTHQMYIVHIVTYVIKVHLVKIMCIYQVRLLQI